MAKICTKLLMNISALNYYPMEGLKMIDLTYHPDLKLSYHVEGRNDYYAIDEYANTDGSSNEGCVRHVESFKTRKQANSVCGQMQDMAYEINRLRGLS